MKVISQVAQQRKTLEEAVTTALELAAGKSDGAEVSVSKTTGIGVSTRYGEVENVEFNSDGALGITVYHQNRKGSASSTDLSPDAIARTVQAALDIARYTSPDPFAGVADKDLLAFDAPDLDLFHPAEVSPDDAIELAARAEQAALKADKRITNTEGGSFNSHYGIKVFGNSHGMLQSYCSTRHSLSSCVIAEDDGDMERDYAYTRALVQRVAQGWYQFNPQLSVRRRTGGEENWLPIFQALNLPFLNEFAGDGLGPRIDAYLDAAGLPERTTPIAAERALAELQKKKLRREQKAKELQEKMAARKAQPPAWGTPAARQAEIERIRREIESKRKK